MQPRMSRQGNYWDNAVAESFFHTLKIALIYTEDFDTHEQTQRPRRQCVKISQCFITASGAIRRMATSPRWPMSSHYKPTRCCVRKSIDPSHAFVGTNQIGALVGGLVGGVAAQYVTHRLTRAHAWAFLHGRRSQKVVQKLLYQ